MTAPSTAGLHIVPATPDSWPGLGHAFGPRERQADSCWCQRFRGDGQPSNREALRREIELAEVPIGLLALLGGEVVGWTRVVPRSSLPGILRNRALARLLEDDPHPWWVSCFVVRRECRGLGIGVALLREAVAWAYEHGASIVEGPPVDVAALRRPPSASAVFTGTLAQFTRAGFLEVGRTYPSRPLMRHSR